MSILIAPFIMSTDGQNETLDTLTAAEVSDTEAALTHCAKQFKRIHAQAIAKGSNQRDARHQAIAAYKIAMPYMDSREHIAQAIACIVAAMHTEILNGNEASKLLYAAQVALSVVRNEEKR